MAASTDIAPFQAGIHDRDPQGLKAIYTFTVRLACRAFPSKLAGNTPWKAAPMARKHLRIRLAVTQVLAEWERRGLSQHFTTSLPTAKEVLLDTLRWAFGGPAEYELPVLMGCLWRTVYHDLAWLWQIQYGRDVAIRRGDCDQLLNAVAGLLAEAVSTAPGAAPTPEVAAAGTPPLGAA